MDIKGSVVPYMGCVVMTQHDDVMENKINAGEAHS